MKFKGGLFKKKWFAYTIATCSAVLLYVLLGHLGDIFGFIGNFFAFVKPIISGIIVAYIFNPLADFYEKKVCKNIKNEKLRWKLSLLLAIVTIIIFLVVIFVALIPQLVGSIKTLLDNMDDYLETLHNLLISIENENASKFFGINFASIASFGDHIVENVSDYFTNNMTSVVYTTSSIGKSVFDAVLALILAIYFLIDKKRIVTNTARLMELIMKPETYEKTMPYFQRCNDIIIRYISVDIIDGIAVGVINLFFMLIMGMPYAVLISVIVGVTNLAPTFGPLVGAALGAFILVLMNPWYALWFLIFTAILQTVDGYILKPRLFGGSLGVSALMILIAIILGGRLFGVFGILIAIPFSAILDFTWRDFVIKKLEERHAKR